MRLENICYRKAENLDRSEEPDGQLIHDRDRDRVHFLNPTAAIIFELCDGLHTGVQIASFLEEAFRLADSTLPEVEKCLSSLLAQGLIEPATNDANSENSEPPAPIDL